MIRRRHARWATVVAAAATMLSLLPGTSGATGGDRIPRLERIVGSNGHSYPSAPPVVGGREDNLFLGLEFDYYCALGGAAYADAVERLGKLAHVIEDSGRTVVFTVAPNKSAVLPQLLSRRKLPQGVCDARAMKQQADVMDNDDDDLFLPLRRPLAQDPRQVYYKTDHHWTSVGGSVFSQELATRLSPRLGRQQRYSSGTETALGVLNAIAGIWVEETSEAAFPANGVTVTTAPGSDAWDGLPYVVYDHSWNAKPARKTWPGQTLLIGDSFAIHALQTMRVLFRHGRFMWTGHVEPKDMIKAIVHSDTVVIEVYQTGLAPSPLGQRAFRQQVRDALKSHRR